MNIVGYHPGKSNAIVRPGLVVNSGKSHHEFLVFNPWKQPNGCSGSAVINRKGQLLGILTETPFIKIRRKIIELPLSIIEKLTSK